MRSACTRRRLLLQALLLLLLVLSGCATTSDYREPDALAKLIAGKETPYLLVDVRTPEEFASGHIPTAVNIPVTDILQKAPSVDQNRLIIVYCASGSRASVAAKRLASLGFKRIVNFGGISRWPGRIVTDGE